MNRDLCQPIRELEIAKLEMGLQRRLSNEMLNGKKTWSNAFNKRKGKEEAEKGKSLENSVFCRLSLYETVLGGLPVRVRSCCCCCLFFVTMLQALFTKRQYLTRVQEFVNVRLNCRTECYLPNWVQVISFPKKLCTAKPWRWRGKTPPRQRTC